MNTTKTSKAKMMWTVSLGGRLSRHLFTADAAKRIARRYNRLLKTDRAYAVRFGKVAL